MAAFFRKQSYSSHWTVCGIAAQPHSLSLYIVQTHSFSLTRSGLKVIIKVHGTLINHYSLETLGGFFVFKGFYEIFQCWLRKLL